MSDDERGDDFELPDDEALRAAFESFLQGGESFDPAQFLASAGLNLEAPEIKTMMSQLQAAFSGGLNPDPNASRDHAVSVAKEGALALDPATSAALATAANVASLWLNEVTSIAELPHTPLILSLIHI